MLKQMPSSHNDRIFSVNERRKQKAVQKLLVEMVLYAIQNSQTLADVQGGI